MRKWITGIPLREEVCEECLWAFWASPLGAGALICQPGLYLKPIPIRADV